MRFFRELFSIAVAVASIFACQNALAVFTINVVETGGNVVATGSGTVNISGLGVFSLSGTTQPSPLVLPSNKAISLHSNGNLPIHLWVGAVTGPSFGSGPRIDADSGSGDVFQISSGALILSNSYVSGNPLNNSATWTGKSFANLGLTPGSYTFSWGTGLNADTFVLNIGPVVSPTPVPALGEYGLLSLISLIAMFGMRQARKRNIK